MASVISFVKLDNKYVQNLSSYMKASDFEVLETVDSLLADARAEVRHLKEKAAQDYESEKKRGYIEGEDIIKRKMLEQIFGIVMGSVQYLATLEGQLTDLVMEATEKIIGSRPEKELVLSLVKQGLSAIANEKSVVLRVAPSNVKNLQMVQSSILQHYPAVRQCNIVPDARLDEKSCIVECDLGVVDVSLSTQLIALRNSIERYLYSDVENKEH